MTILLVLTAEAPPLPEIRCPECRRLLFRGRLVGEIACPRCGALARFKDTVS